MHVAALHGDFFTAAHLRQDMGDPSWVDQYIDWRLPWSEWMPHLGEHQYVAILAFSRGGQVATELTRMLPNITRLVLYEAPILKGGIPAGNAPVLWIWNRQSLRRNLPEADRSLDLWQERGRQVDREYGSGGHLKRIRRASTLWLGHGWDCALNPRIASWLSQPAK